MIYRVLFESDFTIFYQGKKEVIRVTTIRDCRHHPANMTTSK
jgi:hypothetical protein